MRFIYLCMSVVALSFVVIPVYNGINQEHKKLETVANVELTDEDALSLEEMYAYVTEENEANPIFLNNIATAAGGDVNADSEGFSDGFVTKKDPALADTPIETPAIEAPSAEDL